MRHVSTSWGDAWAEDGDAHAFWEDSEAHAFWARLWSLSTLTPNVNGSLEGITEADTREFDPGWDDPWDDPHGGSIIQFTNLDMRL